MSVCEPFMASASDGVASALRAVDCTAGDMTAAAFGRLFGAHGALAPALTILLTLYIAGFAFQLLTGRSTLGISALTPRMMTLGLVLTFATSWLAYQSVMWNLAIGAPDQIAGVLGGTQGSATEIFANRIDMIFTAISEAGELAKGPGATQAGTQVASGSFTPANLMWLSALILLLGTVGVLVTARIALAVLLAVGPVFIVLGLFEATRGLTAGWLRGVVLLAITPLFVVVGGGVTVEMLVPVIAGLIGEDGISGRAAIALFLIASVHVALMFMLMRVSATMVSAWQVFGLARSRSDSAHHASQSAIAIATPYAAAIQTNAHLAGHASARSAIVRQPAIAASDEASVARAPRKSVMSTAWSPVPVSLPRPARSRGRGIGSRFGAAPPRAREFLK